MDHIHQNPLDLVAENGDLDFFRGALIGLAISIPFWCGVFYLSYYIFS